MRIKKMAPDWSAVPAIIIVDILSYLDVSERLSASTTCKRWRSCMLHPRLWRNISLKIKIHSKRKSSLTDACARFVRELYLEFNAQNPVLVRECIDLVHSVSGNVCLESFKLHPSSFRVEWPERMRLDGTDLMVRAIEEFICKSRSLKNLSLGCINDLTDQADKLIPLLAQQQARQLESLFICSVKEDPESYGLIHFPGACISQLHNLQHLGIDYDYLSNDLLLNFCNNNRRAELKKLVIHVHGIEPDREKITNLTWRHLVAANPTLGVTLNLIHSVDGVMNMLDILQPAMPLVKLRMFFCQQLNVAGIDFISHHMSRSFTSLHIIDGMENDQEPNSYYHTTDENPFVMLAWKCNNLKELTLIGYQIDRDDIVAISRLRSKSLEQLAIPGCCVTDIVEYNWGVCYNLGRVDNNLITEVSTNLGKPWEPLKFSQIPRAVFDVQADCEEAYINILLGDQE